MKPAPDLAAVLVNKMVAELLFSFPQVRKAVDRLNRTSWVEYVDELTESIAEALIAEGVPPS